MSLQINAELKGYERVKRALSRIAAVDRWGTKAMLVWGKWKVRQLKSRAYPPPRGDYQRTGRLGRSWQVEESGPLKIQFSNTAAHRGRFYAGFVVGDRQAWMHRGRWWKARDIIGEFGPLKTEMEAAALEEWEQ